MKKVLKKQKLVIKLIIIILIVIGFKPFLQQIEMWRSDYFYTNQSKIRGGIETTSIFISDQVNNLQPPTEDSQSDRKAKIRSVDKNEIKCLLSKTLTECDNALSGKSILSTDKDQQVIANFKKSSRDSEEVIFSDFNGDGIDDILYTWESCGNTICGKYYVVYSANEGKLLWTITKDTHWGEGQTEPDIKFIKTKDKAKMIVIYDPGNTYQPIEGKQKNYSFFKIVNGKYVQVKPTWPDWRVYWKNVSIFEVIFRTINSLMSEFALLLAGLPFIILIIIIITVITKKTIKFFHKRKNNL